ncbi:MAG: ABC transporter ATP-binding protein [Candidatus Omnitrophota bacterium]|nr:ABC transporter ATP-binding protein [Candidatus Omnitrophota bacterium]
MMLEIEALTCAYDSGFILQDINFKVENKEFICIIGPNGSGKTTLLRAMSGLLKPVKGRVLFESRDIGKIGFKELARNIAVVSQGLEIAFMRVEEFVLMGRIPHFKKLQLLETKTDLEIAQRSMDLTDTLRFRNRLMSQISAGERQLVFIARALTQEPKLLLLDEPTTHLDITHQVGVLNLIKRLNRELAITVIMVLHDLNLASEYCRRLILLKDGKIFREGAREDVINYKTIEEVYKIAAVVQKNPVSGKPYVLLVATE